MRSIIGLLQCLESANCSLAMARRPNDWTEATLPDAEIDHRSRPGPNRSDGALLVMCELLRRLDVRHEVDE